MTLWRLVAREIRHRKGNALLTLASVTGAVACVAGALVLLRAHDVESERIVGEKERDARVQMEGMEDEYRKITKLLGFNVLILPQEQDLAALYESDAGASYLPETHVNRLASSPIVTVRHLLPILQARIQWPERSRTILLIGVRGEVPLSHGGGREEPIFHPVPPGTAVVGYELHQALGLREGDTFRLLGREFRVGKAQEQRGGKDDITVWIDLGEAQALLGKQNLISGIMALQCKCAWADIAKVRSEIAAILPGTQVIEFAGVALARAEARNQAARTAVDVLARERAARTALRAEKEGFAGLLVSLAVAGAAVWVALLAAANVRERRAEIGVLRALGIGSAGILSVFIAKAFLVGSAGALLGVPLGLGAGALASGAGASGAGSLLGGIPAGTLALVAVCTPLIAMLSSWVPAVMAVRQDPAEVLREE